MERKMPGAEGPDAGTTSEVSALREALVFPAPRPDDVPSEATGVTPGDWDWAALNTLLRQRFINIAAGKYRFGREEAEDIVQTVFLRVLARDPRVKDPVGYLKIAFLNTCINTAIARERLKEEAVDDDVPDAGAEKALIHMDAVRMVNKAIRSAAPKCKKIIRLYFGQEYSLNEMCDATGYSKKTVWKRIWGCVRRMRECLAA